MNTAVMKNIIAEHLLDLPELKRDDKEPNLFYLKTKFGVMFDIEEARRIYADVLTELKKDINDN